VVKVDMKELEMTILERVGVVAPIEEKMVETLLGWFGHEERRPANSLVSRVD